jgi:hypothetical protein
MLPSDRVEGTHPKLIVEDLPEGEFKAPELFVGKPF